jgi:PHS family inorganic phosphate transporter-like MFS transporter
MEIYAFFMFLGIFTTLCIKETKRVTLEVLSGEESVGASPVLEPKKTENGVENNGIEGESK